MPTFAPTKKGTKPTAPAPTALPGAPTNPPSTSTKSSSGSSSSSSLNGGAIAGIVIGSVAFVALAVLIYRYYKGKKQSQAMGSFEKMDDIEDDYDENDL